MIGLLGLLFACGGGAPLDVPHAPPEWPVAARPVVPVAPVAPMVPVEAPPSDVPPPDTDATP